MFQFLILGGGASGVVTAINLARAFGGDKVCIVEASDRLLKKVALSGNGQGNISNENMTSDFFVGDKSFVDSVLSSFPPSRSLDFFRSLGVFTLTKPNGRIYPHSLQASSFTDLLRLEVERLKIQVRFNAFVSDIYKFDKIFEVKSSEGAFTAKNLIYCLGGGAHPNLFSSVSNFKLLKKLGHDITTPLPALVQLNSTTQALKLMKGVKWTCKLSLTEDGKIKQSVCDEVHFADMALSGPATFFLSPFASISLNKNSSAVFWVDFLPDISHGELLELLMLRCDDMPHADSLSLLLSILPNQIVRGIFKSLGISFDSSLSELSDDLLIKIASAIKRFEVVVNNTYGFKFSQSTVGGVSQEQIDPLSQQSKLVPNLYILGEAQEVCGLCGGYNLQWAWSTALSSSSYLIDLYKENKK